MSTTPEYRAAWRRDQHFGRARTVDAVGTRRRLQALGRVGWSLAELARRSDLTRNGFLHITGGRNPRVRAFVAGRVAALYETLWDQAPPDTPASRRRVADAGRRGWATPMAWDDIDDPSETPAPGVYRASARHASAELLDEVEHLRFMGDSDGTIARRLGITLDALQQALRRAGVIAA